jgi:hypothetical protein
MCILGILPKQKLDRWKLAKSMDTKGYKVLHKSLKLDELTWELQAK